MIYDVSHKIFWGSGSVNIKLFKNREKHQAWTFQRSLKHGKGWSCSDRRKGPCSDLTTGMEPGGNGLCFKDVQQKCDWRNLLFGQTGGSSLREVPMFGHFWVVPKWPLTSSCFADLSKRQGCELFHGSLGKCSENVCLRLTWVSHHLLSHDDEIFDYALSLSIYIYMYVYIYIYMYTYIVTVCIYILYLYNIIY